MAAVEETHNSGRVENIGIAGKAQNILLFSGKRKSGKDYITDILLERIGAERCTIIKISGPIKSHWANSLNLDLEQLLGDGEYKEKYRQEMIKWGEEMRNKDHGYFCRAAIHMYNAQDKPIWIVSDIRRKTDIEWFLENFGSACKTIRVSCDDSVRVKRGWVFTAGVDDVESECDLDDVRNWDLKIDNSGKNIEDILLKILECINYMLKAAIDDLQDENKAPEDRTEDRLQVDVEN